MARGLGDVLDAYTFASAPSERTPTLLVPLARGDWVAAGVVQRIAAGLNARGLPTYIEALDPAAGALCGPPVSGRPRLRVQIATRRGTRRPDGVLAIVSGAAADLPLGAARWASEAEGVPTAVVTLGALEAFVARGAELTGDAAWLAAIPDREAIRAALGARSRAIERAADALAGWCRRSWALS